MLCLKTRPLFSFTFSPPKHPLSPPKSSLSFTSSPSKSRIAMVRAQTIEHIVLFKVKPDTDPSAVNSMLTGLNGLISLDTVVHLTAGPIHRIGSSSFIFTHMLHSRYRSKDDLATYTAHPSHMGVVKESVFPICEDLMAVDWVSDDLSGAVAPKPGSAIRVTLLKLKEDLGEEVKGEIMGAIKDSLGAISCGENFSPARAKGFSVASLAVFPGADEMEATEELEGKVKDHLEGVIVVDYVVPLPPSGNL